MMTIGARIKALRTTLGLTQGKFAERIGSHLVSVSLWEVKDVVPHERTLREICNVFHVRGEWLKTGEGEMFQTPRQGDDDSLRAQLLKEYPAMTQEAYEFVRAFLSLPPSKQRAFLEFIEMPSAE